MSDSQNQSETEEVSIRTTREERELFISLIGTLADDYFAGTAQAYETVRRERRAVWHFIDHVAVKWSVANPFRLDPENQVNKEENGDQEEGQGPV